MLMFAAELLAKLIILFSPIYLIRITVFSLPTNLLDLFILVFLLISFPFFIKKVKLNHFQALIVVAIGLILGGVFISTTINGFPHSSLGILKSWFVLPIAFAAVLSIIDPKNLLSYLNYFFISSAGISLIAIFYKILGHVTYDNRLQAFFDSPNQLAMSLAPGMIFGFFLLKKDTGGLKIVRLLLLLFIGTSLYFTRSYATWLGIIFSLLVCYGFFHFSKLKKISLVFLITFFMLFVSQLSTPKMQAVLHNPSSSSWGSRIEIWRAALKIGTDNFLFGISPGAFGEKYLAYQAFFSPYQDTAVPHPHNIFLALWLGGGILSLAGFLLLLGNFIFLTLKNKNFPSEVVFAFLIYILIHGLADTTILRNDLSLQFWTVLLLFSQTSQRHPVKSFINLVDEK